MRLPSEQTAALKMSKLLGGGVTQHWHTVPRSMQSSVITLLQTTCRATLLQAKLSFWSARVELAGTLASRRRAQSASCLFYLVYVLCCVFCLFYVRCALSPFILSPPPFSHSFLPLLSLSWSKQRRLPILSPPPSFQHFARV